MKEYTLNSNTETVLGFGPCVVCKPSLYSSLIVKIALANMDSEIDLTKEIGSQ